MNPEVVAQIESEGAVGSTSLADFVSKLETPRVVWIMVPAALVEKIAGELAGELTSGDIVIDGGNSYYKDDIDRAKALKEKGIHFVDVGTSGGVFGLERGFCLMIGGETETVRRLDPIFRTLAPGVAAAERTAGRSGTPSPAEQGYLHCGPTGAGHFVKMVHNGIEYGLMAAYAEGLNVLHNANVGKTQNQGASAEQAPLRQPEYYQYEIDVADVAEVWRRGSVIASWLLDLTAHSCAALRCSTSSAAVSPTRARAAGQCSRRSRRAFLCLSSRQPSTNASARKARRSSPTSCSLPCARSSAATPNSPSSAAHDPDGSSARRWAQDRWLSAAREREVRQEGLRFGSGRRLWRVSRSVLLGWLWERSRLEAAAPVRLIKSARAPGDACRGRGGRARSGWLGAGRSCAGSP